MWVSLIIAVLTFLFSKEGGASTKKAALTAAAAGLGTYYVTTETDWGKANLGALDDKISQVFNPDGTPAKDGAGNDVYESASKPVPKDANGNVVKSSDGSVLNNLIKGAADVFKSWGGAGTAAVIGTTAAVTTNNTSKWLLYGGIALVALLVIK